MPRKRIIRLHLFKVLIVVAGALAPVASAHAADAIILPDPGGLTLFALGVAGLLVGRRFAGRGDD